METSIGAIITEGNLTSTTTPSRKTGKQIKNLHPIRQHLEVKENAVFCIFCQTKFSIKTEISTIKKHFQKSHEEIYKQVVQTTNETIDVTTYTNENDFETIKLIDFQLYGWIISDQQPFNVVENANFQDLVFALNPRYKLPTRQAVSKQIEEIFKEQKNIIRNTLFLLKQKMSLTTDAWTACTNQAYLSVTLHWIDKDWNMQHILLDIIPIHENHTGLALAKNFLTTLKEYGIESKILAVTSDNAANMIAFGKHLSKMLADECNNNEFMHFRCAAHILNLAVQAGMKLISEPIEKTRKFSSKIKNSQPLFEELKKIFEMKGKAFLVPEIDTPTRWNSLYLSIKKLYRIKDMTDILVASNRHLSDIYPTDDDWKIIGVSIFYFLTLKDC